MEAVDDTNVSKDIKILSEVEKVWIIYDRDENGTLEWPEISLYLNELAFPDLQMEPEEVKLVFESLDTNGNGNIDKKEMYEFLKILARVQEDRFRIV